MNRSRCVASIGSVRACVCICVSASLRGQPCRASVTVETKNLEPVPTWRLGNAGHALGYQVGKGAMMDGLPFSIARRVTCRVVSILCACIRVYVRREGAWRSLRSKHMYTWKRIASKLLYYVNVTLSSILTFNYRLISEPAPKRKRKKIGRGVRVPMHAKL